MEEMVSNSSLSSSSSKKFAINLIESLRRKMFETGTANRKVPFRALFTAVLVHLGRVLFQIIVTISGFFPTLVILSHIGGFILERWLEILSTEGGFLRLKKTTVTFVQIFILDMVCALEENLAFCVIQDANNSESVRAKFQLPASTTIADLYQEVGRIIQCHQDSFHLILQGNQNKNVVRLNKSETIEMAGFKVGPDTKNTLVVMPSPDLEVSKGSEPRTGSSASPTGSGDFETPAVPAPPPPPPASTSSSGDFNCTNAIVRPEISYVGLVNQAMTCYLNSLLQALFMTPEFRNAMYNWEFDGSPSEESKSIPYQLQKLFLNLQTSKKSAVETTELTRSFGWDSWEAWQQHDIQELCRVMFDTLEQKFKNTKQADLINLLYEGKMIDYVKCLECSTEKSREDTFLDIPLPVRPFGSNVAYGSVEEALRAFVQPETLEGNNQYHCETCNKKCDAHKGLKFSKFPYLLTLHLKRFDFDFNTLHRIKLNDKVSFPEKLNLNSFIAHEKGTELNSDGSSEETAVKCDDSCTTDSGSALDDEGCQGIDNLSMPNSHENHNNDYQEDDEGIDVEQQHENEKNRQNACESGPYVYELFSIMIHSGSAAGGHYYAYIKDFKDGEWYCFNDQNVCRITYDDIRKTYGGGPLRGYYSGAYSSSTNAYMLMYRQIDKERNASAMTVDEFPEHIKVLHNKLERQKEIDEQRELDDQKDLHDGLIMEEGELYLSKLKVYCRYPHQNAISEAKVPVYIYCTLKETVQLVYKKLNLEKVVPIERCRLVSYDNIKDVIECSFEGKEDEKIEEICSHLKHRTFLMDVREEGEEFEVIKPGSINTVVFVVNVETEDVMGPTVVRANLNQTVKEYKEVVSNQLKLPEPSVFFRSASNFSMEPSFLKNDDSTLKREEFYDSHKVYVAAPMSNEDVDVLILSKLHKITDKFNHVITLNVTLPDVDRETLERYNIPPLEQSQMNGNKLNEESVLSNHSRVPSPNHRGPSPQLLPDPEDESTGPAGPHSDQSASEDSSLTDSERTIVGDAPGDCLAQLSPNSSPVHSDQNISSLENDTNDFSHKRMESCAGRFVSCTQRNDEEENWDIEDQELPLKTYNYFFKAVPLTGNNSNQKILQVHVDERMNQGTFKQCLEPFVGVAAEHFNICKSLVNQSVWKRLRPSDTLLVYKDNEKLTVKLGRTLRKGECAGKVFLLSLNSDEPIKYLFEWVIADGAAVSQVKKEILEEMKKKCAIEIPYNRCRLRNKFLKIPRRPYLEGTTFDDLISNWEMFVQELPGEEPVTDPNQKLLIVRQYCYSSREVKPFEEIVVENQTAAEVKEKISEISGIPVEFIETARFQASFSCFDESIPAPYLDKDWESSEKTGEEEDPFAQTFHERGVIFYRDSRDKSKCLLMKELKNHPDGPRCVDNMGFLMKDRKLLKDRRSRLYSPMKERGLKIYLDATPPRKEESDVDW